MAESSDLVRIDPGESVMTRWVVDKLIKRAAGTSASDRVKNTLLTEIRDFATSFAGPAPTGAELVLAETAALSWFALRTYEADFASGQEAGGMTFAQAKHHLRRIEHAQRRLESSLRTLATVRRLALPAVQVNVARNQVVGSMTNVG